MDVAELQMTADAKGIDQATGSLAKLEGQAAKTEKATDKLNRENAKSADLYGKMNSSVTQYVKGFIGITAALAAFRSVTGIITEFTTSMSQVAAISNANTEELQLMTDAAREMGATTSFSAGEAADALTYLAQGGFTAVGAVEALPAVLDLAKSSALDLGTSASITTSILAGFGIETANAANAVDVMAAISARSNTDVYSLGEAVAYVGPVAAAMNVSLGDASAAMGVLSDAGIQGSAAGTGLRRVLSSLANPTKEAADVLLGLGLNLEEVNPATNDLADVIDTLAGAGLSAADALTIFGDRGGPAILALVAENERVRQLAEEMENVDGEAKRMAETMGDNLKGDLDELASAFEELVLKMGDAGGEKGLRGITQGLTIFVGEIGWAVDQIRMMMGSIDIDDYARLAEEAERLKRVVEHQKGFFKIFSTEKERQQNIDALAEIEAQMNKLINLGPEVKKSSKEMFAEATKKTKEYNKSMDDAGIELAQFIKQAETKAIKEHEEEMEDAAKAAKKYAEQIQDIKDRADPLGAEMRELSKEWDMMEKEMAKGNVTAEEWAAFLDYALPEVTVQAKRLKTEIKNVGDESDVMATNFNRGIERMRDGVGDFFQDFLKTGEFTFETVGDLFTDMVAEMIATAAANEIFLGLGLMTPQGKGNMASGFASMFTGGDAAGGGGGVSGMLNGLGSNFVGMGANMYHSIGDAAGSMGLLDFSSAAHEAGAGLTGWGAVGNMAGGFAGAYAGRTVFGNEESTGLGSTAGGIVGSIYGGPWGAALGSFIGEGLEAGINKIFGQKNDGSNAAAADFNFATGEIEGRTWGKSSDPANLETATGLAQSLKEFSDAIGGSDLAANITVGNRDGIKYGGKSYGKDVEEFFDDAFRDVIEASTELNDELKPIVMGFDGSAEGLAQLAAGLIELDSRGEGLSDRVMRLITDFEGADETLLEYATGLASIEAMLENNPVDAALADMRKLQEEASKGMMGLYTEQVDLVKRLAKEYDGSAESTTELNNALFRSQQAAYQMARALEDIRTQASSMFADSAKSIRQSVMSEEELFAVRQKERDQLFESLKVIEDVNVLQDTLAKVNELNNQLFNSIKDPTVAQAEQYAQFAEMASKTMDDRVDGLLTTIQSSQQSQMDKVEGALQRVADRQEASVNTFSQAVNTFEQLMTQLSNSSEEIIL